MTINNILPHPHHALTGVLASSFHAKRQEPIPPVYFQPVFSEEIGLLVHSLPSLAHPLPLFGLLKITMRQWGDQKNSVGWKGSSIYE